jgi:NitT/TauT family transport system substrate-binding protein
MKRIVSLLLTVLLVSAVLCGCAPKELRKITLNEVTHSVFYAPQYAAIALGYFKDEGLEVELVNGGGSDKTMTALLSGEAEFGLMGPETGVYVVGEGKEDHPMVIGQLTACDGSFLVGREKDEDFTWEDLRGKSVIGGREGGMPMMTLKYVLTREGLEPGKDVEVINNIQFNLMAGAFEGGMGDYVTLFEPTATAFEKEGKGYILAAVGEYGGSAPYTCYMTSKAMLEKEPELVQKFVNAVSKAQKWVSTAKAEDVAKAIADFFPDTDVADLAVVVERYKSINTWHDTLVMSEDSFTHLQDIIDESGLLARRIEFKELVDNTFAQEASK